MKISLLLLLMAVFGNIQSTKVTYNDLEVILNYDNAKAEDFLFLKGYKLSGEGRSILFKNEYVFTFTKGETIKDFTLIERKVYKNQNYSVQFETYSEVDFDNMRKSVILKGYKRTSEVGHVVYESVKYTVGFTPLKDDDGDTKYSVFISNNLVNNLFDN